MRLRLATFNLESLDDRPGAAPSLAERIVVLRPQLLRLEADIICLQEVNGQRRAAKAPRELFALAQLLEETPYASFARAATHGPSGQGVADRHNLVILSRFPIVAARDIRNQMVPAIAWRFLGGPPDSTQSLTWDRPILHATVDLGLGRRLEVVNLHLKAPLAAPVPAQKLGRFAWASVAGWAEGYFLASVKRSGQALETRLLLEGLFDANPQALIAVCGDFNCDEREMPFRIIAASEEDTGNGALASRSLLALERGLPEGRRYSVLHAGRKAMLDHLLISRPLLAWYRHAEVHNEALGDEVIGFATVRRSPESYHAPVLAEFALPEI
jgi:endonuclease/exonuclease/phosphatase family metal-dependent hydrolase